jgi:diguanylate cyclase (GGDEF)-like protein
MSMREQMSTPSAHKSTLLNVSLPGRGPGRSTVLLVLLTAVMTIAVLGAVAARSWYGEVQRRVESVHPAVLEWSAESLRGHLQRSRSSIAELAREPVSNVGNADIRERVRGFFSGSPSFSGMVLLDEGGEVIDSMGQGASLDSLIGLLTVDSALEAGLTQAMAAAQLRRELAAVESGAIRLFTAGTHRSTVLVSAPLVDASGGAQGSLHGLLDARELSATLRTDLLGIGTIHLADEAGQIIAQAGEVMYREGPLPGDVLVASATPKLSVPWNGEGAWTVRSARPVGVLGMAIAAEQPVLLAFESMLLAVFQMLFAGGVLAAVFTLVGSLMAVRLTRQLQALLDGIRTIAKSDFTARLCDGGVRGQLALIYGGFNEMGERLLEARALHEANVGAISKQNRGFQKQHQKLEKLCVTDELTQLHNHRFFQDQLKREIKRLSRTNDGLSILIIDIDDFKMLNDTYGHAAGDQFLRQLARVLKESVRETDLLARYGGEEFVVVATGTALEGAQLLAEKLRTRVAETSFIVDETNRPRGVTISVGVAEYGHSRTELFTAADAALYRAKAAGKNCVVVAEPHSQDALD